MVLEKFVPIAEALPQAKLLAVGDVPWDTLQWLVSRGLVDADRLIGYLPHPSPASQERINYFLGEKPAALLSKKTNAAKLDAMRSQLERTLSGLRPL